MSALIRSRELHDADPEWWPEPRPFDWAARPPRERVAEALLILAAVAAVGLVVVAGWLLVLLVFVAAKWALVAVWPIPAALAAVCALIGGRP